MEMEKRVAKMAKRKIKKSKTRYPLQPDINVLEKAIQTDIQEEASWFNFFNGYFFNERGEKISLGPMSFNRLENMIKGKEVLEKINGEIDVSFIIFRDKSGKMVDFHSRGSADLNKNEVAILYYFFLRRGFPNWIRDIREKIFPGDKEEAVRQAMHRLLVKIEKTCKALDGNDFDGEGAYIVDHGNKKPYCFRKDINFFLFLEEENKKE